MYLNSGLEGDEAIYTASEDGFYKLRGYSIYYERNQMMQDYMVSRKDARRVESGTRDVVIQDFRDRMEERKQSVNMPVQPLDFWEVPAVYWRFWCWPAA